jgi:hypothetical protein
MLLQIRTLINSSISNVFVAFYRHYKTISLFYNGEVLYNQNCIVVKIVACLQIWKHQQIHSVNIAIKPALIFKRDELFIFIKKKSIFHWKWMILGPFFYPQSPCTLCFNLNKQFLHILVFCVTFDLLFLCDVRLIFYLRTVFVCFHVLLWYSFDSGLKNSFNYWFTWWLRLTSVM